MPKKHNRKRILITGAAGFLGSHLCDRFVEEDFHVIGMDNLTTGEMQHIEHLFHLPNFEFYHHDVSKFVHVPGPLHYILHFASPASPIDYLKMPIQTLKVGFIGDTPSAGSREKQKCANTSRLHIGSLRRPLGFATERRVLGKRQPSGSTRRLRRGETLSRSHDYGLPQRPWTGNPNRQDIQYLRPKNAFTRRTRLANLHLSSATRQRSHCFRRWKTNPIIHLCHRSDRRYLPLVDA